MDARMHFVLVSSVPASLAPPAPHTVSHRVTWSQLLAGITAIVAAYVYFLIFSEFAFLRFSSELVARSRMPTLIGALGIAGVAGSLAAAARFDAAKARHQLAIGFAACLAAAFLTLAVTTEPGALSASVASGAALGWTTVTLALCLRPTLRRPHLGLWCGLGTGLAYAICNLPPLFNAAARSQIAAACAAAAAGLISTFWIHCAPARTSASPDYKNAGFPLWVVLFLALVFLDSLIFCLVHQNPLLRQPGWSDPTVLIGNAFVHLTTAVLAGVALDRGKHAHALFAALLLLVGAAFLFDAGMGSRPLARIIYITGVSVYSTALIWFAARGMRKWKTAALFSISGWGGSALAIGIVMKNPGADLLTSAALCVLVVAAVAFLTRYIFAGNHVR